MDIPELHTTREKESLKNNRKREILSVLERVPTRRILCLTERSRSKFIDNFFLTHGTPEKTLKISKHNINFEGEFVLKWTSDKIAFKSSVVKF